MYEDGSDEKIQKKNLKACADALLKNELKDRKEIVRAKHAEQRKQSTCVRCRQEGDGTCMA